MITHGFVTKELILKDKIQLILWGRNLRAVSICLQPFLYT